MFPKADMQRMPADMALSVLAVPWDIDPDTRSGAPDLRVALQAAYDERL